MNINNIIVFTHLLSLTITRSDELRRPPLEDDRHKRTMRILTSYADFPTIKQLALRRSAAVKQIEKRYDSILGSTGEGISIAIFPEDSADKLNVLLGNSYFRGGGPEEKFICFVPVKGRYKIAYQVNLSDFDPKLRISRPSTSLLDYLRNRGFMPKSRLSRSTKKYLMRKMKYTVYDWDTMGFSLQVWPTQWDQGSKVTEFEIRESYDMIHDPFTGKNTEDRDPVTGIDRNRRIFAERYGYPPSTQEANRLRQQSKERTTKLKLWVKSSIE